VSLTQSPLRRYVSPIFTVRVALITTHSSCTFPKSEVKKDLAALQLVNHDRVSPATIPIQNVDLSHHVWNIQNTDTRVAITARSRNEAVHPRGHLRRQCMAAQREKAGPWTRHHRLLHQPPQRTLLRLNHHSPARATSDIEVALLPAKTMCARSSLRPSRRTLRRRVRRLRT
jgi:hypothetical protein